MLKVKPAVVGEVIVMVPVGVAQFGCVMDTTGVFAPKVGAATPIPGALV
jgi:hypothetical protein